MDKFTSAFDRHRCKIFVGLLLVLIVSIVPFPRHYSGEQEVYVEGHNGILGNGILKYDIWLKTYLFRAPRASGIFSLSPSPEDVHGTLDVKFSNRISIPVIYDNWQSAEVVSVDIGWYCPHKEVYSANRLWFGKDFNFVLLHVGWHDVLYTGCTNKVTTHQASELYRATGLGGENIDGYPDPYLSQ